MNRYVRSTEDERREDQEIRNYYRLGAFYIRYGRYMRQRMQSLREGAGNLGVLRPQAD